MAGPRPSSPSTENERPDRFQRSGRIPRRPALLRSLPRLMRDAAIVHTHRGPSERSPAMEAGRKHPAQRRGEAAGGGRGAIKNTDGPVIKGGPELHGFTPSPFCLVLKAKPRALPAGPWMADRRDETVVWSLVFQRGSGTAISP